MSLRDQKRRKMINGLSGWLQDNLIPFPRGRANPPVFKIRARTTILITITIFIE